MQINNIADIDIVADLLFLLNSIPRYLYLQPFKGQVSPEFNVLQIHSALQVHYACANFRTDTLL